MQSIKELRLSNNKISQLPLEFGRLAALTKLSLAYNRQLLLEFGRLAALTKLSLA
ncbi:hypothetical protein T484DRAFT_1777989 [Baffinella frigidus]|nr:hypothetical protein T484DRAFT_1777989 [Cryptophyta sp. CCMP2293]